MNCLAIFPRDAIIPRDGMKEIWINIRPFTDYTLTLYFIFLHYSYALITGSII